MTTLTKFELLTMIERNPKPLPFMLAEHAICPFCDAFYLKDEWKHFWTAKECDFCRGYYFMAKRASDSMEEVLETWENQLKDNIDLLSLFLEITYFRDNVGAMWKRRIERQLKIVSAVLAENNGKDDQIVKVQIVE